MKRPSPWLAVLCAGFISMHATGCFGSFKLTQKIWTWNKNISDEKFVQWLMFLVLIIVPVYELGTLIDALVINSIEFWSGKNPVSSTGSSDINTRIVRLGAHEELRMTKDPETGVMTLVLEREGEEPVIRHFEPLQDGMVVRDDAGVPMVRAEGTADGGVAVTDAAGLTRTVHGKEALALARRIYEEGGAIALARHAVLQSSMPQGLALNTCNAR
ncbi:DUF3332 domain-containing protein [Myxococcus stipitatus]|uniref:DUF3332 domain-containing protein n=1 Tax=Myxococcus stipitatus TaxID=83455 RepID=UPI0030D169EC